MNKLLKGVFSVLFLAFVFTVCGNSRMNPVLPHATEVSRQDSMKIGYSQGDLSVALGTELSTIIMKGAIQFPKSYMARLKGSEIVKVRIAIADKLTKQENSIFISKKLDGEPFYTQTVEQLSPGWNDITLDTPVEVTGDELFIGYRYVSSGYTVSFDGGPVNSYANWISIGQDEKEMIWVHQGESGCLNIQAIVQGDRLPQNDASLLSIHSRKYAQSENSYPVNLLVRNMAAADIKSLDVTCSIDGQEPVIRSIRDICIKSNELGIVRVDDVSIKEAGIYDMSVKIDKVNEVDDEIEADNQSSIANIICKDEYTRRKVLLEQFSTAKCTNCPRAHMTIERELKYDDDVIWLIHHAGFGVDNMTIKESEEYLYFYNSNTVYAPAAMLDRSNLSQYGALDSKGASSPGPVFNVTSAGISKLLSQRLNSPALINVNIDHNYDENNRSLTLSVYGDMPSEDESRLKGSDVCLNVVLVEDSIPGVQSGATGTYIHNHVIRKVLTGVWGDGIDFTNGKYHSKDYTFTLPEDWKEKHMRVIAFVANNDQANPNNDQVYNAEEADIVKGTNVSIETSKVGLELEVYSAFGCLYVKGDYSSASIYDTTGSLVKVVPNFESKVSVSSLERGVYFVRFNVKGTPVTKKIYIN